MKIGWRDSMLFPIIWSKLGANARRSKGKDHAGQKPLWREFRRRLINRSRRPARKILFTRHLNNFPKDISEADQTRLRTQAKEAITAKIIPSYNKLKEYFEKEYLPAAIKSRNLAETERRQTLRIFGAFIYDDQSHAAGDSRKRFSGSQTNSRRDGKDKNEVGFKGTLPEFFNYLQDRSEIFLQNARRTSQCLSRDFQKN